MWISSKALRYIGLWIDCVKKSPQKSELILIWDLPLRTWADTRKPLLNITNLYESNPIMRKPITRLGMLILKWVIEVQR